MDSYSGKRRNKKSKSLHQLGGSDAYGRLQEVREVRTDKQSAEVLPAASMCQQFPSSATAATETLRRVEENCCDEENITSLTTVTSAQPFVPGKSRKKKKKKNNDHHQTASTEDRSSALSMNCLHNSGMNSSGASSQVGIERSNFDQELNWCLTQLHLGLARTEASKSQKQENKKLIRILQSSKTPLPRKRQLMRSLFGDYRSKMSKEPVSAQLDPLSEPSISSVEAGMLEEKGRFFKKSLSLQQGKMGVDEEGEGAGGGSQREGVGDFDSKNSKQFCFNFDIDSDF